MYLTEDAPAAHAHAHARAADLRRLLELSCDWYWMLDADCRLVALFGRPLDAGPNPLQAQLGHAPWNWPGVQAERDDFARLRSALLARQRFVEHEYALRDHRGQLRYFALCGEPVHTASGGFAGFQGTTRELTQRKRADALVALEHAVTRRIAEAASSRKILEAVMRVICESEGWETGGFFRTEDTQGTTRLVAGWSGPGMSEAASAYYKGTAGQLIPAGGLLSRVVTERQPLWVEAMTESQTTWAQRLRATGERATFFSPVLADGEVMGVFAFASRETREPDEPLLQTLRVISEQVGQFLKRKQAEHRLQHLATHDSLTGLPNRLLLQDRAALELGRGGLAGQGSALMLLDLDRFKQINDTLGHAAGDEVLRTVAQRLRRAVRPTDTVVRMGGDELVLHYQPLVDSRGGGVGAVEALLRWRRPGGGLVPPGDFIPLAEDTGLIVPIGAWALRRACADLARWRAGGRPGLRVAVNLSPRQFMAEGLEDTVAAALRDSGLPGDALELEITESVLVSSLERAQCLLQRLRALGVRIAIDDFGTGYSSLNYLASFPVQTVKIDRSFVERIDSGEGTASLAGAIVALAHSLGFEVVAEGVETPTQCRHLVEAGCELLQGFLFSPPVPSEGLGTAFERAGAVPLRPGGPQVEVWALPPDQASSRAEIV